MGLLPRKKTAPSFELDDYCILIVGPKKIGKTRLLTFIPGILIYSLEPASKGRAMYQIKIKNWKTFKKSIKELEHEDVEKFPVIGIDTIDVLWQLCANYVCEQLGIERLGYTTSGKQGDYGASHAECKKEMLTQLIRITSTGRTIALTSHTKMRTITTIDGDEYHKVMPSITPSCLDVIKSITDMNFMLDYARVNGEKQRILLTQGDSRYFAGCSDPSVFPDILPLLHCFDKKTKLDSPEIYEGVSYESPWELLCKAFLGEVPGINPTDVETSLESGAITEETIEEMVSQRKEAKRKKRNRKTGDKKSPKKKPVKVIGKKTVRRKKRK